MAGTPQERLLARLRADFPELSLPEGTRLERTYRNRRTGTGRWSWHAFGPDMKDLHIGSHWSMRELLSVPRLQASYLRGAGDTCIDPEEP
jgi:hypothetical protein